MINKSFLFDIWSLLLLKNTAGVIFLFTRYYRLVGFKGTWTENIFINELFFEKPQFCKLTSFRIKHRHNFITN